MQNPCVAGIELYTARVEKVSLVVESGERGEVWGTVFVVKLVVRGDAAWGWMICSWMRKGEAEEEERITSVQRSHSRADRRGLWNRGQTCWDMGSMDVAGWGEAGNMFSAV